MRLRSGVPTLGVLVAAAALAGAPAPPPRSSLAPRSPAELQALFRPTGRPLPFVSAHRGGAAPGFPENCIATFERTLASTFAILEIDPRMTRDGAIVVHHDATLERTTTGTGRVADHTLAELKALRLKDPEGRVTDHRIPTLDEVLDWARGRTVLVLDQKDVSVEARVRAIEARRAEAHAMLIVGSLKDAQACHALNTNLMMEVMIPDAARAAAFTATGIPWRNVVAFVGHLPPEDPALYAAIHSNGASCMVGTSRTLDHRIDAAGEAGRADLQRAYRELQHRGADILETDRPIEVASMLFAPAALPPPLLWLPFDEGGGTVACDRSPNAAEAELHNVRWARGAFGTAVRLGGTNAFIEVPPVPGLDGATRCTVSAWVTWEDTGRYPNLLTTENWSPGGLMLFVRDESCSFRLGRPGHRAGVAGESWEETGAPLVAPLPRRTWTHVCAVFDRPRVTTYVNGRPAGTATWPHPVQAGGIRIGAWQGPVSHCGLIDDVRMYGCALAAGDVAALAVDPSRASAGYTLVPDDDDAAPVAVFENRHARMAVDARGRIASLFGKASNRELLARPQELVAVRLADGRQATARRASRRGDTLRFDFGRGLGSATVDVATHRDFLTFTVRELTVTNAEELTFLHVPAACANHRGAMANMLSDDADAVCVRGYDLAVEMSVGGSPPSLRAWTTAAGGHAGRRAGLAAGSKADMPAMLRAMAAEADVPVSRLGGPWSLGAGANRGSYLFADLDQASTDDWIGLAHRGGFTHIHIHGWWRTLGHYEPATNLFPEGMAGLKSTVDRIHSAGLQAGVHTLTACIDTRDPWVTPEPSPHLLAFDTYTLARALSPTDTVVHVHERPSARHDVVFTYSGNGNAIRIGSEILQYAEVLRDPPYGFSRCTRGAFGTRTFAHAAGGRADYLQQRYMAFYPAPDSPLADELAGRIAGIVNGCGLDQIYFDGSEGMMSRYGIDAMRHAIYRRLRGDVLAEASCHGAHNWWFHSRLGAWDHPVWAAKRFQDRHVAVAAAYRATDLLKPQMGWWAPRGPSVHARGHFLDEMEYFACKNLGLDAAMSVQGVNVTRAPLAPYLEDQITLLGWYERLRLARHFDPRTVARVAVPGDEFRLRQDRGGAWRFTPVRMDARRTAASDGSPARWTWSNPYGAQPLGARIEALYAAAPGESPHRRIAADAADLAAFRIATAGPEATLTLAAETADTRGTATNLHLTAACSGSVRTAAWTRASLTIPAPYRTLAGTGALGVWVRGDGGGALLNIQIASPREYMHGRSDHHVRLDFTGWRHVELLLRERDVDAMGGYAWPYGGGYDLHRNAVDLAHVSEINLYLHDLPPGRRTDVVLGPIVALPVVATEMRNPSLTANGRRLEIPVTMKSGDFLDVEPSGLCIHRNDRGDILARVRPAAPDAWPEWRPGANGILFGSSSASGRTARAEVTPIACGEPFGEPDARRRADAARMDREYEMTRTILEPDGPDNTWEIAVRPGGTARLEIELSGAMAAPALAIGGCVVRFPVTLKPGERLLCRDGRTWRVLDAKRATVAEGRLDTLVPALKPGPTPVAIRCAAPDKAQVRLTKVYR